MDIALYSKKGNMGCWGDTGNKASQVEGRAYAKSRGKEAYVFSRESKVVTGGEIWKHRGIY